MVGIGVGLGLVLALGQISGKLVEVQSSYMGWCPVKLNYIEPLLLSTIRFPIWTECGKNLRAYVPHPG